MHQRKVALEVLGSQIREEILELLGDHEALVHDGARREAGDVEVVGDAALGGEAQGALLDQVEHALERAAWAEACDEQLRERGHGGAAGGADRRHVHGNVAPAEHALPVVADHVFEDALLLGGAAVIPRQEHLGHAVVAGEGQLDADAIERALVVQVRDAREDAGAIARFGIGTGGASVGQPAEQLDPFLHDQMRGRPDQIRHEPDAARIVLARGIVQAGLRGLARHGRPNVAELTRRAT